jgi:hypothetical protein
MQKDFCNNIGQKLPSANLARSPVLGSMTSSNLVGDWHRKADLNPAFPPAVEISEPFPATGVTLMSGVQ